MGRILEESIKELWKNHIRCRVYTSHPSKSKLTFYTGYIKDYDGESILFVDKYGVEIPIVCTTIQRIVRFDNEHTPEN